MKKKQHRKKKKEMTRETGTPRETGTRRETMSENRGGPMEEQNEVRLVAISLGDGL